LGQGENQRGLAIIIDPSTEENCHAGHVENQPKMVIAIDPSMAFEIAS
jgi:hypothetical protein